MAQSGGFSGDTELCVVSCHHKCWDEVLELAKRNKDAVAAVYELHWGGKWAMYYGANVTKFGGSCKYWLIIHGPDGPTDLGITQRDEIEFLRDQMQGSAEEVAIRLISLVEYASGFSQGALVRSEICVGSKDSSIKVGHVGVVNGFADGCLVCSFPKWADAWIAPSHVTGIGFRVGELVKHLDDWKGDDGSHVSKGHTGEVLGISGSPDSHQQHIRVKFPKADCNTTPCRLESIGFRVGELVKFLVDWTGDDGSYVSKGHIGEVLGVSDNPDSHQQHIRVKFPKAHVNTIPCRLESIGFRVGELVKHLDDWKGDDGSYVSKGHIGEVLGIGSPDSHQQHVRVKFPKAHVNTIPCRLESIGFRVGELVKSG